MLPDPDAVDVPIAAGRPVLTGAPPPDPQERLRLLVETLGALVIPDLRGTLVLRLDDPGAAVKRHLREWAHADLPTAAWNELWAALDGGRISVFCCPGWVDADGRVRDSRVASPTEWAALHEGVRRGVVDLECHGFTHMDPDTTAWAGATDRFTEVGWYRELWPPRLPAEPAVAEQAARLRRWQDALDQPGTALVAPGEAWGAATVAAARDCGFRLFNSWGICRLDTGTPVWSRGVGSPYLDEADRHWTQSDLPTVGYFHDRDLAVNEPDWVRTHLGNWRDCGVARIVAFADLAHAYEPIDAALLDGEVVVASAPAVPLRTLHR